MFEEFNQIVGGPGSSRRHKLICIMGWAHNNDVLPEFRNIKYNNDKFYIPKEDIWIEIDYPEVRDILVHELIEIIRHRKIECDKKGVVDIDGPNVFKRMLFALEGCDDELHPDKNFKKSDTDLRNIINLALKLGMDIKDYTSVVELSSGPLLEEITF
jgi:hypothetical protein